MTWHWPQYTLAGLQLFALGMSLARDGSPKKGNESFIASAIGTAVSVAILYYGGFWTPVP